MNLTSRNCLPRKTTVAVIIFISIIALFAPFGTVCALSVTASDEPYANGNALECGSYVRDRKWSLKPKEMGEIELDVPFSHTVCENESDLWTVDIAQSGRYVFLLSDTKKNIQLCVTDGESVLGGITCYESGYWAVDLLAGMTYFVKVRANNYYYESVTAPYTLVMSLYQTGEPNERARKLSEEFDEFEICCSNDYAVYEYYADNSGIYEFTLDSNMLHEIRLYDSDMRECGILSSNEFGLRNISVNLDGGKDYFIYVHGREGVGFYAAGKGKVCVKCIE